MRTKELEMEVFLSPKEWYTIKEFTGIDEFYLNIQRCFYSFISVYVIVFFSSEGLIFVIVLTDAIYNHLYNCSLLHQGKKKQCSRR